MIILLKPAHLPAAVREFRTVSRISRRSLARTVSEQTVRTHQAVYNQWQLWEAGGKSPQLWSLGDYLGAHRLRLALVPDEDDPLQQIAALRAELKMWRERA